MLSKRFLRIFAVLGLFGFSTISYSVDDVIGLFPIENYDQTISHWINPNQQNYDQPLMNVNMQKQNMQAYLDHYVGKFSPWSPDYINRLFEQTGPDNISSIQQNFLSAFDNEGKEPNKIGYGENFRPYSKQWINRIANNLNLSQFESLSYEVDRRAIAVENLNARALPTEEVFFYHHKLAGEGYPFDNLQVSVLWAGTPVYIVGESRDKAWMLVITPEYVAWVKSKGIAKASNDFVYAWQEAANTNLAAITRTETSLTDAKGNHLLTSYVGSVFPGFLTGKKIQLWVPVFSAEHKAEIGIAEVSGQEASLMPLTPTPHNFSQIMETMISRTYGWGGMYFYNDCSAELKSLLTPFGVWLPRNSGEQATYGKKVDLSSSTKEQRLSYLTKNGHPFLTLIYIGGHIILYVGNYPNPNDPSEQMVMTYQNIWGLKPAAADRRAVIGQSVLFPMLLSYPEDASLNSLAASKYFKLSYMDQLKDQDLFLQQLNLKSLMLPKQFVQ